MAPHHVHPLKWRLAIDLARTVCGRFYADGRSPPDVLRAFNLPASETAGWHHAVNALAELHASAAIRNVA